MPVSYINHLCCSHFANVQFRVYNKALLHNDVTNLFSVILTGVVSIQLPGSVAQWVAHLTHEPEVLGLIPGPTIYFHFSFC